MKLLVFSDVDGTLLDHDTYSIDTSRKGISLLTANTIPLILVSSKTYPEMESLQKELGISFPFIFENGGGIAYPSCEGLKAECTTATTVDDLRNMIPHIESIIGKRIIPITDLSPEKLSSVTGLPIERAKLSQLRQTSLPFLIPDAGIIDLDLINASLSKLELIVTKGGRFYHLLPKSSNKGNALHAVVKYYSAQQHNRIVTAGIGDSENDLPMLSVVDFPFVVRKKDGNYLRTDINGIHITQGIGPEGFTESIIEILKIVEQNNGDTGYSSQYS